MKVFVALLFLVSPLPALAAPAQAPAGPPAETGEVTVRGPERMVCRPQVRTATRMRTSKACRTVSDWRVQEETVQAGSYDNIDDAAFRAMGVFERDVEWDGNGGHTGPLGPR